MSHALVSVRERTTKQLDLKSKPDEVVSENDVTDTGLLRKLITRILTSLSALTGEWRPRKITFRDIVSTGTSGVPIDVALTHKFGGPVEYEVVDIADGGTITLPLVMRLNTSTKDVLNLRIYFPATLAIRVTEGG